MMMLIGTIAVLASWLAFVWFADPDGFRRRAVVRRTKTVPPLGRR